MKSNPVGWFEIYVQDTGRAKTFYEAVLGVKLERLPSPGTLRYSYLQPLENTMAIHLDHLMVPSRNKAASAKRLADLLGVPWSETGAGPFAPVYTNDGLTLDFDEWADPFPRIHYCFRVGQDEFNAILARIKAAGIPYRGNVHGPVDFRIGTRHGGSIVYWNEPDGHQWEMLTVSYARPPQ